MAAGVPQLASATLDSLDSMAPPPRQVVQLTEAGIVAPGLDAWADGERTIHARLVAAVESERAHIARELHDVVGQALTVVRLNLLSLDGIDGVTGASGAPIDSSLAAVDDAIRQVRSAAFDLRPAVLDDLGLAPALRALCRLVARRSGIAVSCRVASGDRRLPPHVETTCYRIIQEALTNVVRHSGARRTRVRVFPRPRTGVLVLEVLDDGVGFDPTQCTGARCIGIRGMAERASLVDGTLEVRSAIGTGTRVTARLRSDLPGPGQ
jgi:signal transduction histidine kinase